MKFKLFTAKHFYYDNSSDVESMEKLKNLGLVFERPKGSIFEKKAWTIVNSYEVEVEFDTLEKLMDFVKEWSNIIMDEDSITIYNDYLG